MARQIHYASDFSPGFGLEWIPPASDAALARLTTEQLARYAKARQQAESDAARNPVGHGWKLPIWDLVMKNWKNYSIHVLLGGNQCVAGTTRMLDPVTGIDLPIQEIDGPFNVIAWNGKELVITPASAPFVKGTAKMIEIVMCNVWRTPHTIICTGEHKIMGRDGAWIYAKDLKPGDFVFAPLFKNKFGLIAEVNVQANEQLVWDITVPEYGNYLHENMIHSNSAKSTFGSRLSLSVAAGIPEAEVYNFHVNEQRSVADQQRLVYEALSDELRNLPTKKGIHHSLQYGQKNGFTDNIAILPPYPGYRRGGSIKFHNYAQFQQNDQMIEGVKGHLFWLEEKVPLALLETIIKGRLMTYHGRVLLTYTVIDGWNDTVERILGKTKTLLKKRSERLKMDLPVMQESLSMDSCAIYYAWTEDNPFTDVNEFWKLNATASKDTILCRAYGIPTKSISTAFPLFNKEVHVIAHEKLPWLNLKKNAKGVDIPYKTTRYMSIDLGGSKNWCMLWVAVDARGTWWVYDEWPDIAYGDWAMPGDKAGPAQKGLGHDIAGYVEIIKQKEDGVKIFERFIDPRMGAAERQSKDRGAVTVISDLEECGLTVIPAPAASSDADRGEIEDGIQLVNNLLHYDTERPLDSTNSPRMYISDRCQNFIYSMAEYTGKLGSKEHTKDFADLIRYLRKGNCEYVDESRVDDSRTGVY